MKFLIYITIMQIFGTGNFCTMVHTGNTENGLGMKECSDVVELGIYKDGEAKLWEIISYPDEGYYRELLQINEKTGSIEVSTTNHEIYDLKFNFGNLKEIKKVNKIKLEQTIWEYRSKLLANINDNTFGKKVFFSKRRVIVQESKGKFTMLKFRSNGVIKFVNQNEKKDIRKRKIY